MELPILYRPIQNKILIGILCVVGTIILTVSTSRYGVGVSVDSVGYMADARILTARFDPSLLAENIFVLQPPLYPIILATVSTIFQCDPLSAARFVSVAAFALTLYCAGVLLHRAFPDFQFLAVLGTTAVLFSHPLFQISNMAWTEPIFIFLTVLFLLSCGIFYETHKAIWFGIMVMCAIVAPFVRYIGVVFAPSGALVLLLVFHKPLRIKIKYAIFLPLSPPYQLDYGSYAISQ